MCTQAECWKDELLNGRKTWWVCSAFYTIHVNALLTVTENHGQLKSQRNVGPVGHGKWVTWPSVLDRKGDCGWQNVGQEYKNCLKLDISYICTNVFFIVKTLKQILNVTKITKNVKNMFHIYAHGCYMDSPRNWCCLRMVAPNSLANVSRRNVNTVLLPMTPNH